MLYVISNPTEVTLIHWVCIYNLIIVLRLVSTGTSSHSAEDHLTKMYILPGYYPSSPNKQQVYLTIYLLISDLMVLGERKSD